MDDLAQRLVAQVCAGTDAAIGGTSDAACRLLAAAMDGLRGAGDVIVAGSAEAELSLSALIAGISGQSDYGGQDDSVLELGFRRLTGPGQTILVLRAPAGISRSALRYVQHIGRLAPRLVLVVLLSAPLEFMLAEPAFAALRSRLRAAPPIDIPSIDTFSKPARAAMPELPAEAMVMVRARPRRSVMWLAATALGIAAVAGGALLVYGSPFASWGRERELAAASVPMPAQPVPPMLAAVAAPPAPVSMAAPAQASVPAARLAAAAPPELVAPQAGRLAMSTLPPLLPTTAPVLYAALPPLLKGDRTPPTHRVDVARNEASRPEPIRGEPGRWTRSRSLARLTHDDELERYAWDSRYPEPPPPVWVMRAPRPREAPFIGTYAVDPYGRRVFRYDP